MKKAHMRTLIAAGALLIFAGEGSAGQCIFDLCYSNAQINAPSTPVVYFMCPAGDTGSFSDQGFSVTVEVLTLNGVSPVVGLPAADIEVGACVGAAEPVLCSTGTADTDTDANGMTVISQGYLAGGGCGQGLTIYLRCELPEGTYLLALEDMDESGCTGVATCLDIIVRSPDLNGDFVVGLTDLSLFAEAYPPNVPSFPSCADMNGDDAITLADLSRFAEHYGPPGHVCP